MLSKAIIYSESNLRSKTQWIFITIAIFLFWFLRISYWNSISEQPFSDMADYWNIAKKVWCCFSFEHNDFWKSYKPPGLPLIAAPFAGVFEDDFGLYLWRFFSTSLLFSFALWLTNELCKVGKSFLLGFAFFLVVTLSKSSIFWSYRFSTESISEAFFYGVLAYFLFLTRQRSTQSSLHSFGLGLLTISLALIRPNMAPVLAIIPLGIFLCVISKPRLAFKVVFIRLLAFSLGVILLWSPWIARSIKLYGHPVIFSTQGPYSFLWELGGINFEDPKLGMRNTNADQLQIEAPRRFENDYAAAMLAKEAGAQWLQQTGYSIYLKMWAERLLRMATEREIALSKTPRDLIFNDSKNSILIDKSVWVVLLGSIGLLLAGIYYGTTMLLVWLMLLSPIGLSACFLGDARMLEPFLPLIIFGAVVPIIILISWLKSNNFRQN